MLDESRIKTWAEKAARVAYTVLGLDCKYSVVLINDPAIIEDGLLNTEKNEIQLNLALLEPFPHDTAGTDNPQTEKDRLLDEDYRHPLKVCYIIFHEMRHLYQKRTIEAYSINQHFGGKLAPQRESDKKCALWLEEMKNPAPGQDIEEDANDFAYYLTNRYPLKLPMLQTNRRIGSFKRKYDKLEIPEL